MKKFTESFGNIAPPAVTKFSDSVFYYSLNAGGTANVPVPADANYAEITASQFVAVTPASISGGPNSSPSSTAGTQTVTFNPNITSGTSTGLPNSSLVFTAVFQIDGVIVPWFDIGSNLQTFGALVTSINSTLSSKATATITAGKLLVTSATTGVNSKVRIINQPVVTLTPTPTLTATTTATVTPTISITPSVSRSITVSPTVTSTPSGTPKITDSPGITVTPSVTPTLTKTPAATATISVTPTLTATKTITPTVTQTITVSPSATATVTLTKSVTPTISVTPSSSGSGVFFSITSFVDFDVAVDGNVTSSNAEVVLTTVKQVDPVHTTVIGIYAPTSGTIVSVSFYK